MGERTDGDGTEYGTTNDDEANDEMRQNDGTRRNDESADAAGGWTQVARRHYDPDDATDLTTVVVTAIAAAEGVTPRDVRPVLYEHVDVSTVADVFFGSTVTERERPGRGRVEFRYDGYRVEVASDGRVTVSERTGAASAD